MCVCVCVCVYAFFPFILDIKFVGRTSRGHTGGRSHRISHPPSFCGACLNFSREKDSAISFPRRPRSRILCTNDLIVPHPLGIFSLVFLFFSEKNPVCQDRTHVPTGGLSLSDESFPNEGARGAFAKPSRSVSSRRLRGASKAPPRTLRGGSRTLRGGCTHRRLHEDALEGSRGLLEGSVDELHVPTRS